tara:strand:+ start:164 stop:409 length:246 start_codon:yes stop_codon:yes gene_type:complete
MNIKLAKVTYAATAIVAGLTVGVVLSVYVGVVSCLQTLFSFPLHIYNKSITTLMLQQQELDSEEKDIWEKHINRRFKNQDN